MVRVVNDIHGRLTPCKDTRYLYRTLDGPKWSVRTGAGNLASTGIQSSQTIQTVAIRYTD
jgi:hypothetical protein